MEEFKEMFDYANEIENATKAGESEYLAGQGRQRTRIQSAYGDGSNGFKVYGVSYACMCGANGFYESTDPFRSFRCGHCGLEVKL